VSFQLLIRLCGYVPAVEELARKDDLTLLFSAVTSPVPEHNLVRPWVKPGNPYQRGRFSTVDLPIKVACFVGKKNNISSIKMSYTKLVDTRWSTVRSLSL